MGNQLSSVKRKRNRKGTVSVKSGSQPPRSTQVSVLSSNASNSTTTDPPSLNGDTKFDQARYDADQVQELHYLFKHIFQRNLIAPVENLLTKPGAQCLDIGCGPTATWLIDMAAEFPQATFTGIDIVDIGGPVADSISTPTPPSLLPRHIPTNCHFKKVDVLKNIDLACGTFDHVYQRFMFNVYQMDDSIQPKFLELAALLKPGGYIELIEPDMVPKKAGPKYTLLTNALNTMLKPRDKPLYHGPVIKQLLIDAGLVDVQADYTSIPICWGGYVGKMLYETIVSVLGRLGEPLWPLLELEGDYDEQVFIDFMDSAMDECADHQTYVNFYWAYGKRPIENDSTNKES